MKKVLIIALLPLALACSNLSGPAADLGSKIGSTADKAANNGAAILGKAVELDLPGLIKAAGSAVADLVTGVSEIVASPVESAQTAVGDVVAPDAK